MRRGRGHRPAAAAAGGGTWADRPLDRRTPTRRIPDAAPAWQTCRTGGGGGGGGIGLVATATWLGTGGGFGITTGTGLGGGIGCGGAGGTAAGPAGRRFRQLRQRHLHHLDRLRRGSGAERRGHPHRKAVIAATRRMAISKARESPNSRGSQDGNSSPADIGVTSLLLRRPGLESGAGVVGAKAHGPD